MNKNIAIIGCGNLGTSILKGLIDDPSVNNKNITVTKRNTETLNGYIASGITVTSDNYKAIETADIVIIGLKPHTIIPIISDLKSAFNKNQTIISLATSRTLQELKDAIGNDKDVFRAMPNTASDVQESLTCISTDSTNSQKLNEVRQLFDLIGESIVIEEKLMESATVLGACGIAYVLRFIRAMIQGGIQIGFDAKTATKIVNQTVKGASELLIERKNHPEYEIDKVTTPRGCTIAGLNEMEHNGFSSALIKGIITSYKEIEK